MAICQVPWKLSNGWPWTARATFSPCLHELSEDSVHWRLDLGIPGVNLAWRYLRLWVEPIFLFTPFNVHLLIDLIGRRKIPGFGLKVWGMLLISMCPLSCNLIVHNMRLTASLSHVIFHWRSFSAVAANRSRRRVLRWQLIECWYQWKISSCEVAAVEWRTSQRKCLECLRLVYTFCNGFFHSVCSGKIDFISRF